MPSIAKYATPFFILISLIPLYYLTSMAGCGLLLRRPRVAELLSVTFLIILHSVWVSGLKGEMRRLEPPAF